MCVKKIGERRERDRDRDRESLCVRACVQTRVDGVAPERRAVDDVGGDGAAGQR